MSSDYKKVTLYVYDLSMGLANQLSRGLVGRHFEGIWHTGIVVYNTEYFFGGGIQRLPPGMTPYGVPVKKIELGTTTIEKDVFEQFLQSLARDRFRPDRYHLFDNNCNNFTDEAAKFLLGTGIPDYIKNLPQEFFQTDLGRMLRPIVDSMMGASTQPIINEGPTGTNFGTNTMGTTAPSDAFGGMGGLSGFGGMGNMAEIMNNPMVQQMMNNPQMMNEALNNPMVQQMMSQYGLSGSDVQNMMSQMGGLQGMQANPMFQNMMSQMGGFGGGYNTQAQQQYQPMGPTSAAPINTTFNDDKSIMHYGKANVAQVVKKMKSILTEKNISLSKEEETVLNNLERYLASEVKNFDLISQDTFQLLDRLMKEVPEKDVFPVLDLLRLLVQTPSVTSRILSSKYNVLATMENKFVEHWSEISMPTQLMVLRTYCNMFPKVYNPNELIPESVKFIISSNKFTKLVDIISTSLTSKLEGLRLTAASLASNLSLYMAKDGNDEEIQLICSMAEYCSEETSEETKQRMLLTIYRICKDNPNASNLVHQLGYDFDKMITTSSSNDTKLLVNAIKKM